MTAINDPWRPDPIVERSIAVQALLDAGQLTEKPAYFPLRNIILQALGANDQLEPQLSFIDLKRGDCVLLCSDGLSNKVGDVEMHCIVRELASLGEAGERLVALAIERGGEDNITLIMARLDGGGGPLPESAKDD